MEKFFYVTPGKLQTDCKNVVYLVRPKSVVSLLPLVPVSSFANCPDRITLMKQIAEHIRSQQGTGAKKEFFVFFVPRRTMICERVLEEEGVFGGQAAFLDDESSGVTFLPSFVRSLVPLYRDHVWRVSDRLDPL